MKKDIEQIKEEIRKCTKCRLGKNRNNAVPGEGPSDASILFIGEAPGKKEDQTGRPFVGRAGKLLDQLLEISGLDRNKVFITSVIKCHPPKNRKPKRDELETCINLWMYDQIKLIDPELIVILGGIALKSLLNKNQVKQYHGKLLAKNNRNYFITYHPAAGIRFPKLKNTLVKDFELLKEKINSLSQNLCLYF